MSDSHKYTLEVILEHIITCEKRFSEIHSPNDFNATDYGITLLDAIVIRLQAIGENFKRLLKHDNLLFEKYPEREAALSLNAIANQSSANQSAIDSVQLPHLS